MGTALDACLLVIGGRSKRYGPRESFAALETLLRAIRDCVPGCVIIPIRGRTVSHLASRIPVGPAVNDSMEPAAPLIWRFQPQ